LSSGLTVEQTETIVNCGKALALLHERLADPKAVASLTDFI